MLHQSQSLENNLIEINIKGRRGIKKWVSCIANITYPCLTQLQLTQYQAKP